MQCNITTSLIVSLLENGFGLDELIYRMEELANKRAFPQLLKTIILLVDENIRLKVMLKRPLPEKCSCTCGHPDIVLDGGTPRKIRTRLGNALATSMPHKYNSQRSATRLSLSEILDSDAASRGGPAGTDLGGVIRLLELFAEQGVTVDHAGDGDLDGFVIAERISKAIAVRCVIADEFAADEALPRRPVSPQMRRRWESYLFMHPDFAYTSPLRIAMQRDWIEQESFGKI